MIFLAPLALALAPAAPGGAAVLDVSAEKSSQKSSQKGSQKTNLERALETITVKEIQSDLYFIASDAMKGRDSPSPQLKIAARFIRARLQRLGFQPGAQNDSYFYEWTYPQMGLDRTKTYLRIAGSGGVEFDLAWSRDYFMRSNVLGMREVKGPAVWADDLDKKTLERIDVEGRWVLGLNETGFSNRRGRQLEQRGALGVVLIPDPDPDKRVADAFKGIERRATTSRLSSRASSTAKFPVLYLDETAGSKIAAEIPNEAKAGDLLDMTVDESCGYGKIDDAVLENVVGIWPGSDPDLKDELIILSAHYDHVGSRPDGTIFNGADDNGSGTTGMLAIAEALEAYGPMRRSIMLMWVSAEEKGLLGSQAWCLDPYLPGGLKPLCNINIDMIGRNAADEFLITPTKKHTAYSALTKVAEANAKAEGFTKIGSADAYWQRSDQYNFEHHLGLPVAFLFCDVHDDYHKPTDTPDKINYDKMRRICRLVVRMLEALQIDRPKF